jgi:hypothetical protein
MIYNNRKKNGFYKLRSFIDLAAPICPVCVEALDTYHRIRGWELLNQVYKAYSAIYLQIKNLLFLYLNKKCKAFDKVFSVLGRS